MIDSVRLSQAMIVKNEEATIERALNWGKTFLDEQIVVDTGSTDRTVELAEKAGAKIYHFDWIDDFSAAKNFAKSKCTGDWIFFLDADEYLEPVDVSAIRETLHLAEQQKANAIVCTLINLSDTMEAMNQANLIRIIKNTPDLFYYYPIHEQLVSTGALSTFHAGDRLTILHTGYTKEAMESKDKYRRNLNIIRSYLRNEPDDYIMISYLADEYRGVQAYDKAIEQYYRAIEKMPEQLSADSQRAIYTFSYLLEILITLQAPKRVEAEGIDTAHDPAISQESILDLCYTATSLFPTEATFDYDLGLFYYNNNLFSEAADAFQHALQKLENHPDTLGPVQKTHREEILAYLGASLLETGHYESALECSIRVLSINPYHYMAGSVLLSVGKALMSQKKILLVQFLPIVEKLYHADFSKDRWFLHRIAGDLHFPELKAWISGYFTDEERQYLDEKIKKQ